MRLNQVLSREKDLEHSLKSQTKSLKNALERHSKGKSEVDDEQFDAHAEELLDTLAEYFQIGALRTWADANKRVDVVVEGDVVVSDVPVQYLILAEKQLKYLRDAFRYLPMSADDRLDTISGRIERLHNAVRFARQEANAATIEDEPSFGDALINYILEGQTEEGADF